MTNEFMGATPAADGGNSFALCDRVGADHFDFKGQVFGTQIHHAQAPTRSVITIPIAVILPPEWTRPDGPRGRGGRSPRGSLCDMASRNTSAPDRTRCTQRRSRHLAHNALLDGFPRARPPIANA